MSKQKAEVFSVECIAFYCPLCNAVTHLIWEDETSFKMTHDTVTCDDCWAVYEKGECFIKTVFE